jgi:hypothetical protein
MSIVSSRSGVDGLGAAVDALREWQYDAAPMQLHSVYVEAPLETPPTTIDREELRARYARMKASRTEAWYRKNRPAMQTADIEAETSASRAWISTPQSAFRGTRPDGQSTSARTSRL